MKSYGFSQIFNDQIEEAIIGIKVYLSDGSIIAISVADRKAAADAWLKISSLGIQAINLYFAREYVCYVDGKPETFRYKKTLVQEDYYWLDADQGFGAGEASDVPITAAVKSGTTISDTDFLSIFQRAFEDRRWDLISELRS